MAKHELKTWIEPFRSTWDGLKLFEYRKNDRDFKVGDILILKEYEPTTSRYSGREIRAIITHILHDTDFGVAPSFCVMGISITELSEGFI